MYGKENEEKKVIRFKTSLRNTILDVMVGRGWIEETDEESNNWDVYWADVGSVHQCNFGQLRENQKLCHFPNHYEFTRKDQLYKTLRKYKRMVEKDKSPLASKLDFFPLTFVLPQDYGMFREEFKKKPGSLWIAKPLGAAQGRGIFLVSKLSQVADWKQDNRFQDFQQNSTKPFVVPSSSNQPSSSSSSSSSSSARPTSSNSSPPDSDVEPEKELPASYLVQKYLENPFLVGGKKFDLRIYVLVPCFMPLTVWLYRTGFARFSFHHYTMDEDAVQNTYVHLTNVAIQKTSPTYDPSQGCKWDLRQLKMYIASKYSMQDATNLFANIQDLILMVLLAAQQVIISDKHSFELYGFDVLIDDALKPWLLEVNASPSLTADTPMDYHLKYVLLNDMYDIIDMEKKRTAPDAQNALTVGGFDLIYKGGYIPPKYATVPSMLGTYNNLDRFPHELPARLMKYEV